ncbi:MAG TPA: hypothetical protein VFA88_12365 [Gaiellaceae bacterium]|nr:hypothetical protein [Gaiellaceae bacterium]
MVDEITLTIPPDREFHRVAHLVVGGLALRLDLTIEALEDLQIALDTLLGLAESGGDVTVVLTSRDGIVEARVGPVDVVDELDRPDEDDLGLQRVLATVVDDVDVDGEWVRLTKRVKTGG